MSKKVRILHVLQSGHFSGAENVVCKIIKKFKENDNFEMAYCSKSGVIESILKKNGIKYFPMKRISRKELKSAINNFKPDIIHAHDATASVISSTIIDKTILISHLHSNPPWLNKININSMLYLLASIRFKNILVVSESIYNEFIFKKFIKKKYINIGNPVDISYIRKKSEMSKNSTKEFDLIYVGRLVKAKNPIKFIRIVKEVKKYYPNVRAVMIGDGDLKEECIDMISKYNLIKNIELKGFLENPYKIMNKSKILCVTSEWEGFGLVAVEALALGVPVLCSGVGGLGDIINSSVGEICKEEIEFVNEIKKYMSDDEYLKQKSNVALERANYINNINLYRDKIEQIYKGKL